MTTAKTKIPRVPCQECFRLWQEELEAKRGWWLVRSLVTDQVYFNKELREDFNLPKISTWQNVRRLTSAEEASLVEDSHHAAVKTGGIVTKRFRLRIDPKNSPKELEVVSSHRCHHCRRKCGIVISKLLSVPL